MRILGEIVGGNGSRVYVLDVEAVSTQLQDKIKAALPTGEIFLDLEDLNEVHSKEITKPFPCHIDAYMDIIEDA